MSAHDQNPHDANTRDPHGGNGAHGPSGAGGATHTTDAPSTAELDQATTALDRWRLMLGDAASEELGGPSRATAARDAALDWLYGRGQGGAGSHGTSDDRAGGTGPSQLTVPEWINAVHTLFPKSVIERLESDAVERYGIDEVVTNPEVLDRVEPSTALLAAVLRSKHLMNPEVLQKARRIVKVVVERLLDALQSEVRRALTGPIDRRQRTALKSARNFDFKGSIAQNLKYYDPQNRRIVMQNPRFHGRNQRALKAWQVILLVDQSGSMLTSTIHAAVSAACLWGLPGLRTHLCAFDTEVVDLTSDVTDPVEMLMKVQLGGGTNIAKALAYGTGLIRNPRRTVVVLISDLYEGGSPQAMHRHVRELCQQGSKVLVLGALDERCEPDFDRAAAQRMAADGAHVGAMTPLELVSFVAEALRS